MLRIIDRYIIRETISPFFLALVVFTFILQIPPLMQVAKELLEKGVDTWTIVRILGTLVPQALGVTIPMALLVGLLISLGRLSADREAVALQACGVSLPRLLRPVALIAIGGWLLTTYVMVVAIPAGNRKYQDILHELLNAKVETDVKPRVFFEDFPNLVLYARGIPAGGGGWEDIFLADSRDPGQPQVMTARKARMLIDRKGEKVDLILENGTQHRTKRDDPTDYRVERFASLTLALDPSTLFPKTEAAHDLPEMTIAELQVEADKMRAEGRSPHNLVMAIQQKFSIPVACAVFALLALSLGVNNRKDGKQASFVIGIGVVFVYWALMYMGQSAARAHLVPAIIAMWIPNIVLGLGGVALLLWRHYGTESGVRITLPSPDTIRSWFRRLNPWRKADAASAPDEEMKSTGGTVRAAGTTSGGARSGKKPVVLVIRVPHGMLPRLKLIDRYIGGQYLQTFALAFLGMLGIFYIATFIDLSDKLFKGQASGTQLVLFLWYSTPQYIYYLLPLSALVATLVTIGLLTKSSELIVMRACGVSLYRVTAPLLMLGLAWAMALFGLEETILANANREAEKIRHVIRGGTERTFDVMNRQWVAGKDGRVYHYTFFDARQNILNGLSIYRFEDADWRISERIYASQAVHRGATWEGENGWTRAFDSVSGASKYGAFVKAPLKIESVDYFRTEQPDADRMSFTDLRRYVNELRISGFDVLPYRVALHRKISFPFVALVMTLIGVPFAVTTGRRGALYGIGIGIFLAISYWGLFILFTAIGGAGMLAPALAAWAPNILFLGMATYLLLTVRT